MKKRLALTAPLLLLATTFCHARTLTLAEADAIIVVLIVIVIVLLVLGGFGLHYNRVISRRNEQLLRILNALDDYRAIVADGALSLDEQEDVLKSHQSKRTAAKAVKTTAAKAKTAAKTAEKKVAAKVEKTVAKVEKTAAKAKTSKMTFVIQSPMGGNITPEEIAKKVGSADTVYIRVDENKAYWVKGEETGSVDLW